MQWRSAAQAPGCCTDVRVLFDANPHRQVLREKVALLSAACFRLVATFPTQVSCIRANHPRSPRSGTTGAVQGELQGVEHTGG